MFCEDSLSYTSELAPELCSDFIIISLGRMPNPARAVFCHVQDVELYNSHKFNDLKAP